MHSLSIVVPAYNEERRLGSTLQRILQYLDSLSLSFCELIVVDDGSRDGTARLVESFCASDPRVRLLRNPGNRGKGYSVCHGFLEAKGEWVLFTDADLSAPIEELPKLFSAIQKNNALAAVGSRALDRSLIGVRQPWFRETAGKLFNVVMRVVTGLPFRDTQCGFKLFAAEAARKICRKQQLNGFGFDVELLYIAKLHQIRVVEVPVRWNDVEGTTVSTWRGLHAFIEPLQIRWYHLTGRYR